MPPPAATAAAAALSSANKAPPSPAVAAGATTVKPSPTTSRPARKQITQAKLDALRAAADKGAQAGLVYNVWYNRYSGGSKEDTLAPKTKSQTRCDIARDSGWTRADRNGDSYTCLFFARGCCPSGSECTFLHRLPTATAVTQQGVDIFGREKLGDYRDDMGGVGSMQRMNRTLYVGRIVEEADAHSRAVSQGGGANLGFGPQWRDGGRTLKGGTSVGDAARDRRTQLAAKGKAVPAAPGMSATEKVLRRHFGEWGDIERVRVLHGRSCGFVTYRSEASAQFAKEAMMNQSLDHDEVLNVRWATDDPNPGAQRRDKRERERMGFEAIASDMSVEAIEAGEALARLEAQEYESEETKRRRLERERQEDEELARLEEENRRGWEEIERLKMEQQQQKTSTASAAKGNGSTDPTQPSSLSSSSTSKPLGLLSADALQHLQALKATTTTATGGTPTAAGAASRGVGGGGGGGGALGGLADYASDSD